jgi:aminopeptidase N
MSRLRSSLPVAAAVLVLASVTSSCFGGGEGAGDVAAATTGPAPVAKSGQGVGDPYYPDDGNPGYDVRRYLVRLSYFRPTQNIVARTTVTATAGQRLRHFHLDLVGLTVTGARVDGVTAAFRRPGAHELVITPARPIAAGRTFTTRIAYHGKPGRDPLPGVPSGWYDASTPGAGFVAGEPHSCTVWYPCNDHPTDKAKFELVATVPRPFAVVSNGAELPVTRSRRPNGTPVRTYHWRLSEATATYLTTMYIDKLTFERSVLPEGIPVVSAYGPDPGAAPAREARLPEILDVLAGHWGSYPAPQAGGIFVNGDVPFSLETFTRPIYTEGAGLETIVHENAHQWWGDNVSVKRWRDICFNECLASYSQWLWREHEGADLDQIYLDGVDGSPSFFDAPLYDMGAGNEFDFEGVYLKGTYFVHALRNLIGDDAFFAAMRRIQVDHAGGNMSMLQLRNVLERETGTDLGGFWDEWVLGTGVPSDQNLYPGDLGD